jgi:hypothetical protein
MTPCHGARELPTFAKLVTNGYETRIAIIFESSLVEFG